MSFKEIMRIAEDFEGLSAIVEDSGRMRLLGPAPEVKGYLLPINGLHVYMTDVEQLTEGQIRSALEKGREEADAFIEYQDCRIPDTGQRYV